MTSFSFLSDSKSQEVSLQAALMMLPAMYIHTIQSTHITASSVKSPSESAQAQKPVTQTGRARMYNVHILIDLYPMIPFFSDADMATNWSKGFAWCGLHWGHSIWGSTLVLTIRPLPSKDPMHVQAKAGWKNNTECWGLLVGTKQSTSKGSIGSDSSVRRLFSEGLLWMWFYSYSGKKANRPWCTSVRYVQFTATIVAAGGSYHIVP